MVRRWKRRSHAPESAVGQGNEVTLCTSPYADRPRCGYTESLTWSSFSIPSSGSLTVDLQRTLRRGRDPGKTRVVADGSLSAKNKKERAARYGLRAAPQHLSIAISQKVPCTLVDAINSICWPE